MENTTILIHNQRRAVLCQAFQDISDFINTPLKNSGNTTKVKIWIRNPANLTPAMPAAAAGAASAFYSLPAGQLPSGTINNPNLGGIVDNEIWKTIHTGISSFTNTVFPIISTETNAGFYHGWASFNFAGTANWNLDYNKTNSSNGYLAGYVDFYSTIIHEITHALGFNSLIKFNGSSEMVLTTDGLFGVYYSRFDKYLKTSTGNKLISNSPTFSGQMYDFSFTTSVNNLYPGCSITPPNQPIYNYNSGTYNCPTSIKYVGGVTVPVYTPYCFERGSSLSHFEDACYNSNTNDQYFMMSDRASGVFAKRFLTPEERQVLCDIGYSVKGTFGSAANFTYKDYGVTACSGITVAGVNDGFTTTGTYSFQGNSGTNITISGILSNDYTAGLSSNLRYEFVQDLYDPNAVFSITSGGISDSFTFKSYVTGVHLLRYVPYDNVTGQRGNITYIYINVLNNCVVTDYCNLVRNGDFEEHAYAPNFAGQIYKACGWQNASYRPTSDYYNSDATTLSNLGVPSNMCGNQLDKITGKHAYAGMFISPNRCDLLDCVYSESLKTELLNSLLPNTQYQLTFDVSMADNFLTNSIKFQAFITDTNLELTTGGIIPIANITSDKVFLTNPTFSGSTSATTWQTITFTFTTGSNTNLKYLYIGGLNNVQFQGTGQSYYYLDNVNLTRVVAPNFLDAVNDDLSSILINSTLGGVTSSVYANDLYNGAASSAANVSDVIFSLVSPSPISGASINNMGLISVPPNTPAGTYFLTYKIQTVGSCTVFDTATAKIIVILQSPTSINSIRANDRVDIIKQQSDGKIIISGIFSKYDNILKNNIARLNTNLTLDQSFVSSGQNTVYRPLDIAVQPDDKLIVVGGFSGFSGGSNGNNIARLNINGAIDVNFNVGGLGTTSIPSSTNNQIQSCVLQPDNKILIGGDFGNYNGQKRLGIARLLNSGAIDLTFNPIELNNYSRVVVYKIGLQADGKIVLLGNFSDQNFITKNVIRLLSNGQIDISFTMGTNNLNSLVAGILDFNNIAFQSDGKIILVGNFAKYNNVITNGIIRLNSSGVYDPSFTVTDGVNGYIEDVLIEPISNKIIIAGNFYYFGSTASNRLARLNTNGTLDTSFSVGSGTFDSQCPGYCPNGYNYVRAIKRQLDGKIIVGGKFTAFNNITAGNITRIFGDAGVQAKHSNIVFQSEPEIDTTNDSTITVYPNPSDGIFYFNLIDESNDTQLTIFNLLGEQVFNDLLIGNQENKINLSYLAKGCYLVKLSNAASTTTQKLIKN